MSRLGENAHSGETVTSSPAAAGGDKPAFSAAECPPERLEWQTELDSAMADIDHRLEHPGRRATNLGAQPTLPQLGQIELTSELLDEIAWRVSEQVRRTLAESNSPSAAEASPETAPPAPGIALTIRIRKPLFGFRFWRRRVREESLISLADPT